MISGIDVSTYNGFIDWRKVKGDGISFAMIKATQGKSLYMAKPLYLFTDSRFAENLDNAFNAGISIGVYHFLTASTKEQALEEADYFLSVISKFKDKIELWAAVDVEDDHNFKDLSRDELSDIVRVFCTRVREGGFEPMIYTNRNYIRYKLNYNKLRDIPMWQAHWSSVKPEDTGEALKIWQYSSGRVNGIETETDLNYGFFKTVSFYQREVTRLTGIEEQTVDYINKYQYSEELWKKIWLAIVNNKNT